jgi:hypothetical protein
MKNLLIFASILLVSGIVMVSCSKEEIFTEEVSLAVLESSEDLMEN